jgi:hypothetical protein
MMPGFEEAWDAINKPRSGEPVSAELKPLLRETYQTLLSQPRDFSAIQRALQNLLQYLSAEGRTNANCWATDLFFLLCTGWERDWADPELPEPFNDIFSKMADALHDTVSAPEIARNFGCLPEQLLADLNRIPPSENK